MMWGFGDNIALAGREFKIHVLESGTFSDNTPASGSISWSGCKIYYNGEDYDIADGSTDKTYVWWELNNPNSFQVSDTAPDLTQDDTLIAINRNGTAWVWYKSGVMVSPEAIYAPTLSAISANLGIITAGVARSFNWGASAGVEIDFDNETVKFGGSSNPKLSWDGSALKVRGQVVIESGSGLGNLSDADADHIDETATRKWAAESGADKTANHPDDIVYYGASPPSHKDGRLWYDSANHVLKRSDGVAWHEVGDITEYKTAAEIANLPATPSGSGLFCDGTHLGFYDGGAWKVYIGSDGKFLFKGDDYNYIDWNMSEENTLTIKGKLSADDIKTGTLTGRTVQTSDSGQRVVIDGANDILDFYNANGNKVLELGALSGYSPIDTYGMQGTNLASVNQVSGISVGSSSFKTLFEQGTMGMVQASTIDGTLMYIFHELGGYLGTGEVWGIWQQGISNGGGGYAARKGIRQAGSGVGIDQDSTISNTLGPTLFLGDITLYGTHTIDGMDPSAHIADADAHHARSHDHSAAADGYSLHPRDIGNIVFADQYNTVQDAINALGGPGTVYFPPGTYTITAPLVIGHGVHLVGSNRNNTVIQGDLADALVKASAPNRTNILIENLKFDNTDASPGSIGVDLTNIQASCIRNCIFTQCEIGILLKDTCYYNDIYSCTFTTSCDTGIKLTDSGGTTRPNENRIIGGYFNGCDSYGIYIDSGNNISIIASSFENCPTGVYCNSDTTKIFSCRFEGNTVGVDITANADKCAIYSCHWSGNTTNISDNGVDTLIIDAVQIKLPASIEMRAGDTIDGVDISAHATNASAHHTKTTSSEIDHGNVQGLGDDDHPQYLLASGARKISGDFLPSLDDWYDLGSPTYRFQHLYLSGDISVAGLVDGVDISAFKSSYDSHVANANAHHNRVHALSGGDHTGDLAYSQIDSLVGTGAGKIAAGSHASQHENGGADEIDVTGLSGQLADAQIPIAHALTGAKHTAAGLSVGQVIRATGESSFEWQQLQHDDLGGVSHWQHHSHASSGAYNGAIWVSGNQIKWYLNGTVYYINADGTD